MEGIELSTATVGNQSGVAGYGHSRFKRTTEQTACFGLVADAGGHACGYEAEES